MNICVASLLLLFGAMRQCAGSWMDVTFRVNKLNFVWSKAARHLTDKTLIKRLKNELDKFDKLYLSAKSRSMKNEMLALEEVDTKLEQLLSKYGLESALTAYHKKHKWRNEEEMKHENSVLPTEKFVDPKLQKLWHAARNSHFSEAALKALHKELKDHERKMELYHQKVSQFNELHDNALDEYAFETNERLNRELKEHHSSIMDSYDKLQQKVSQMSQKVFNNEKVETLWRLAIQNPNFTSSELESIRIELNHFDKHLEKLKYHDAELMAAKKRQEQLGKSNVFDEDISSFEEENKRLARKLRKLENYLQTRIFHTEL